MHRSIQIPATIALMATTASSIAAQQDGREPLDLLTLQMSSVGSALPLSWQTRAVRGQSVPATVIVDSGGVRYLHISGTKRAAWFYRELDFPLDAASGTLEWSWRVPKAPEGASSAHAATDDAALRVFVVFARHGVFATSPRALFYTVADGEPTYVQGRAPVATSVIVGRPSQTRTWTSAEANPRLDYRRLWGGTAPRIVAIGVMQDTDQTMTLAIGDLSRLDWRFYHAAAP